MSQCNCIYCARIRSNPSRDSDRLVSDKELCVILGGVSHMYPRRRRADPRFCFPPQKKQGRRTFTWHSDIVTWAESPHAQMRTEFHDPRGTA